MSLESFKRSIELGRQGFNQGFSMGLPKLEELIGGITKSTMTLLFASSGNLNQFYTNFSKKTGRLATSRPGLATASAELDRQRVLQGYCPMWRYGICTRRAKNQVCRVDPRFFAFTGMRGRGWRPCDAFHVSEQVATHGGGQ